MRKLPTGKLPPDVLRRALAKSWPNDPRVLIGPAIGEDAAAIDFGPVCLIAKTDPITFTGHDVAWYAVNVNANDVATMGARPRWFLCTVLFPEGVTEEDVDQVFTELSASLNHLGVALCGGHTEVTPGLDRTIVVGQMLGEVLRDRLVDNTRLVPGDRVLLAKGVAIEGTALLARERAALLGSRLPAELVRRAQGFLTDPGLSVVREALAANEAAHCRAMHDPTEGGLATGLRELAIRADVGLHVFGDAVHFYDESLAVCSQLGIDPLGTIASGALLIGVTAWDTHAVLEAVRKAGSPCDVIAEVREPSYGLMIERDGRVETLPAFDRDEILKVFEMM